MGAEKLSISLDSELTEAVRAAAADDDVSVSTWLSRAAEARIRQWHLRNAVEAASAEHGSLSDTEIRELVDTARQRSLVTRPKRTDR